MILASQLVISAPTDIPGVQYWGDYTDVSTITTDGTGKKVVADKSGNGRTATQFNATVRNILVSNVLNGKGGLDFQQDTYLVTDGFMTIDREMTVFVVHKPRTGHNFLYSPMGLYAALGDAQTNRHSVFQSFRSGWTIANVDSLANTPAIFGWRTSNTLIEFYQNGVSAGNAPIGDGQMSEPVNRPLIIGSRTDAGNSLWYDGVLFEVVVYFRRLTDEEINSLQGYLYQKYAIGTPTFGGGKRIIFRHNNLGYGLKTLLSNYSYLRFGHKADFDFSASIGFTIGAWLVPLEGVIPVLTKRHGDQNGYQGWDLQLHSNGIVYLQVIENLNTGKWSSIEAPMPVDYLNKLAFVVAVTDGPSAGNMRLYWNGSPLPVSIRANGLTAASIYNTTLPMLANTFSDNLGGASQNMFATLLYNRPLSADEVKSLYASTGGCGRVTDGLVGLWTFDHKQGTVAKDFSGRNNHATLVNYPHTVPGPNNLWVYPDLTSILA